jgi:serine/threonine protein kinase
MLHVDPKQRYRAIDVLNHDWIKYRNQLPETVLSHQEISVIKANMGLVFSAINKPSPISLDPVKTSDLARRRANRRSKSPTSQSSSDN